MVPEVSSWLYEIPWNIFGLQWEVFEFACFVDMEVRGLLLL